MLIKSNITLVNERVKYSIHFKYLSSLGNSKILFTCLWRTSGELPLDFHHDAKLRLQLQSHITQQYALSLLSRDSPDVVHTLHLPKYWSPQVQAPHN